MLIKVKKPKQKPTHLAGKIFVCILSLIYIIPCSGMSFLFAFFIGGILCFGGTFMLACLGVSFSDAYARYCVWGCIILGIICAILFFFYALAETWDAMK